MPICKQCNLDFPNRMIINGVKKNLSSRKFCIKCSPWGKHNTRSSLEKPKEKLCPRCDITKHASEFYKRRRGIDLSPYCKPCTNQQTIERQRKFKAKCVEYKGGSCINCGYKRCQNVLEFHHLDPAKKDFSISKNHLTKFDERTTRELDKCVILCRNCHGETHAGLIRLPGFEPGIED